MFRHPRVRLSPELYRRAQERARALGLPDVEAYVTELLERDLKVGEEEAQRERVLRKMKGLGYLE